MSEMKSLAEQLRSQIAKPAANDAPAKTRPKENKIIKPESHGPPPVPKLIQELQAYDNSDHKSMVHVRFDAQTAQMLAHFKMATGVEVTRVVAYAMGQFIKQHPEMREIIKSYFKNLEL